MGAWATDRPDRRIVDDEHAHSEKLAARHGWDLCLTSPGARSALPRAFLHGHALCSTVRSKGAAAMTVVEFIVFLVVAGVCGAIARAVAGGSRGGFIVSILLGFLGAFLGSWVAHMFHLPEPIVVTIGGRPFPIVWSIVGGAILVALAHALTRRNTIATV
jgi:uncharacterized membrane protein YeaQ/YmgE (transglycosylase-associated protein family)